MASKVFNQLIRDRRLEMNLTQQEVSTMTNLSLSQYQSLEDGRTGSTLASKSKVEKVSEVLQFNMNDIYIEDFKDTQTIVFGYPKGGTGKSTLVAEVSYHLAKTFGKKVLVVDGDHQRNVSKAFGMDKNKEMSLRALLEADLESDGFTVGNYIQETRIPGVDIIVSDTTLNGIDRVLYTKPLTEVIFDNAISSLIDRGIYDYIMIDTSPHLGALTINLYFVASKYYMPINMEPFATDSMESLTETITFVKQLRKRFKSKPFNMSGIIRTKVDLRESITKQVTDDLKATMAPYILDDYVPIDAKIKKAQYEKLFLDEFDKNARSNEVFKRIAKEVMK